MADLRGVPSHGGAVRAPCLRSDGLLALGGCVGGRIVNLVLEGPLRSCLGLWLS